MKDSKYLMESLDNFVLENTKLNQDVSDDERIENVIRGFGIDPEEIYYPSLKEGIYKMAAELYSRRGSEYIRSGWVNPN